MCCLEKHFLLITTPLSPTTTSCFKSNSVKSVVPIFEGTSSQEDEIVSCNFLKNSNLLEGLALFQLSFLVFPYKTSILRYYKLPFLFLFQLLLENILLFRRVDSCFFIHCHYYCKNNSQNRNSRRNSRLFR